MDTTSYIKPNFLGLIPFIVFIVIYIGTGVFRNSRC